MSRYLGIDWDQNQLYVALATATRSGVRIERVAFREEALTLKPAQAEAAGHRLREILKDAKMAAAPVIACLGRDRFILKELRYPPIAGAEEATLVRFQTARELTESPESVVIDYTALNEPAAGGEQRTFALAVRKETLACYNALCRAAGLKLVALTPRALGLPPCLKRIGSPYPVAAVLTVTGAWAEFSVVRGDKLLYTRALAVHNGLVAEVRRNLAAFAGQAHVHEARDVVQALYVAADGGHAQLRQELQELLAIPVLPLEPTTEAPAGNQAGFAGIVGLLDSVARQALPINFARPKEPKPPENPEKKRNYVRVAVAALLLIAAIGLCSWIVNDRGAYADQLAKEAADLDALEKKLKPDVVQLEALTKWQGTGIALLDEFYDLAAHFDSKPGLRIEQITVEPKVPIIGGTKKKQEEKYSARIVVKGEVANKDANSIVALKEKLRRDGHRSVTHEMKPGGSPDVQLFTLTIDVAHKQASTYAAQLVPPPPIPPKRIKGPKPPPPKEEKKEEKKDEKKDEKKADETKVDEKKGGDDKKVDDKKADDKKADEKKGDDETVDDTKHDDKRSTDEKKLDAKKEDGDEGGSR